MSETAVLSIGAIVWVVTVAWFAIGLLCAIGFGRAAKLGATPPQPEPELDAEPLYVPREWVA